MTCLVLHSRCACFATYCCSLHAQNFIYKPTKNAWVETLIHAIHKSFDISFFVLTVVVCADKSGTVVMICAFGYKTFWADELSEVSVCRNLIAKHIQTHTNPTLV